MLYEYLCENYGENNPIFVSELNIEGVSKNTLREQIKRLTDAGKLRRYDTGVYYIPKDFGFKSGISAISAEKVMKKRYLYDKEKVFGYLSGYTFVNKVGLSTQVPMVYELVSNNTTTDYRKVVIGKTKVIVRKPRVEITNENADILQFLDLLMVVDTHSELEGSELKKRILEIMAEKSLTFSELEPFLKFYPDKIYKILYEMGVIASVST